MIGPFIDFKENPILKPDSGFDSRGAYNPTVIKQSSDWFMLYRAENFKEDLTGKIGFARSKDGVHFTKHPQPVIIPDHDFDRFGCEDPRLTKIKDTYYLTYVGNCGSYETGNICLATSRDLTHWEKHGSILKPQKDWDHGQVKAGAILAQKVNGKYLMYFMGEKEPWKTSIGLAYSDDLINFYEPLEEPVLLPRKGYFDSMGVEPGPPPLLTKEGIWFIYCGWSSDCVYKVGAALFSRDDPSKVLERSKEPIFTPAKDWGEFFGVTSNHAVPEGLVEDKNRWLLYYGAADKACCLAIWER